MKNILNNNLLNRMAVLGYFWLSLACFVALAQTDATLSPVIEGRYLLRNIATGKYLTVTGAKYENGTALSQTNYTKDYSQQFYVSYSEDEKSVQISSANSDNLMISVNETAAANGNGAPVKLLDEDRGQARMQWTLVPTARPRIFTILSLDNNSKKAIGTLNATSTQVVQWKIPAADARFQWEFIPIVEAGWYLLQNVGTGMVMTTKQASKLNGTPMVQAEADTENEDSNPLNMKFEVFENTANVYSLTPGHTYGKKWLSVAANGTGLSISSVNEALQGFEINYISELERGFNNEMFTIRSTNSQKLIGTKEGNIVQSTAHEKDLNFQWRFIPLQPANYLREGDYIIQNVSTKSVMDLAGAKLQNGTGIVQWPRSEAPNQIFEVRINDDCKYQILPALAKGTKYVTVTNKAVLGNDNNNTFLDAIYAGEAIAEENEEYESNIYQLKSGQLSLGVVGKSNGSAVVTQNVTQPNDSFKWRFIPTELGSYLPAGLYTIQNVNTNLMMDVAGALTANGSKVVQFGRSNANNQKFEVSINENGHYNIAPVYASSKWLSVMGGSATNRNANGTQLFITDANKTDASVAWQLESIPLDEDSEDENIFAIRSIDPSSKKVLGVNSSSDRRVVQLSADPETNTRLQWRFIPTTKSANNGRMSAEALSELDPENVGSALTVMPNPLRGDFELKINQFEENDQLKLSIFDMQGKPVYQNTIGTERSVKLNTEQLQMRTGNYIIEINNGIKRQTTKIMVID